MAMPDSSDNDFDPTIACWLNAPLSAGQKQRVWEQVRARAAQQTMQPPAAPPRQRRSLVQQMERAYQSFFWLFLEESCYHRAARLRSAYLLRLYGAPMHPIFGFIV